MKILLDTHVLLWALSSPGALSTLHRDRITDPTNIVYATSINLAEIAIKSSIGKLEIDKTLETDDYRGLRAEIEHAGFDTLAFTVAHAARLRSLPFYHRDPFDRMIIAQALVDRLPVLAVDSVFAQYPVEIL